MCETDKPSGNWDRKASQILGKQTNIPDTQSWHHNFWSREPSNTHKGKESIHVNASPETASMICKLIGSVNHLCILFVITRYMDDLLEKTIEAEESNTSQVKFTHLVNRKSAQCLKLREEVDNTV